MDNFCINIVLPHLSDDKEHDTTRRYKNIPWIRCLDVLEHFDVCLKFKIIMLNILHDKKKCESQFIIL